MHAKNFLMGVHAFFEALQHETVTAECDDDVCIRCIDNIITFGKFGMSLLRLGLVCCGQRYLHMRDSSFK